MFKQFFCKHDWYEYGDLLEKEGNSLFIPKTRECIKCKKGYVLPVTVTY